MGTKYSMSNNEEIKDNKKTAKAYYSNKKYNCETEDLSIIINIKENTDNSSLTTTTENMENHKNLVPFPFEWKYKANNVILKGSFANDWDGEIILNKNPKTGVFEKIVYLPKIKHSFKFIVDGKWTCSNQYPTFNDNGHINNFIDLTNSSINSNEDPVKKEGIKIEQNNINNNINIINDEKSKKKAKKIYNCKIPSYNELNITAPTIIHHYIPTFNIDYQSKQDLICKSKTKKPKLKYKEKNFDNENNTFKKIMVFPHEKLMHLCPNLEHLNENNDNYFKLSTTVRNKHKYLTIVYYRPK